MGDGLREIRRLSTIAVDWSGRAHGERRAIWLAEVNGDELVRLEDGRSRAEIADELAACARREPSLVVGLDFSFSLPAWFLEEQGFESVDDLWAAAAERGEAWLAECAPPFWGRAGTRRPDLPAHFRATELALGHVGGIRPKSTFQVSGAGSVGAGSVRGFPVLARLRAEGFAVWPFDDPVSPVVLEVWPRLLTGPVVKRDRDAREAYLDARFASLPRELRRRAIASDDAFDAAVSALEMARHRDAIDALTHAEDPVTQLEGATWRPPDD